MKKIIALLMLVTLASCSSLKEETQSKHEKQVEFVKQRQESKKAI